MFPQKGHVVISLIYKSFFQSYMDFSVRTNEVYETRIMERPGRWMSKDDLSVLSSDLADIASHTLPRGSLTYGVFSGTPSALKNTIITLVRRRSDGKPVAFNALALMDVDLSGESIRVLHLGLVMVDPNEQSRGLSWVLYGLTCMLFFFRNQFRQVWISNVTQVPAIVGLVTETFSEVYPAPGLDSKRSLLHLLIAREIQKNHRQTFGVGDDAKFDENRFVLTNAYTGGSDDLKKSFDEAPKHRRQIYNSFCEEELNYQRGDDVLQLGKIDLFAIRRYLMNSVPRRSLGAFLLAGTLLMLQRIILPAVYWFDGSKDWNSLRARKS